MLLTIISTLLGLVSSTIPGILQYFKQRQADNHELEIGRLKLEAATRGYQIAVDIAGTNADVAEMNSARQADHTEGASPWVVNISGLVRPLITLTIFFIFVVAKLVPPGMVIVSEGMTAANLQAFSSTIVDDAFMGVFSVIIAFYFGSRAIEKYLPPEKTTLIGKTQDPKPK